MEYYGNIGICGKEYSSVLKNGEITIIDSREDLLRKKKINEITGKWINLKKEYSELFLKLSFKSFVDDAVILNVDACYDVFDYNLGREEKSCEIHKLTFRSDVLDFFYRPTGKYIDSIAKLIKGFGKDDEISMNTKKYKFKYNQKEFELYFGFNAYLKVDNIFPFDVFNSLNIECNEEITLDEIYNLSFIVKKFLSFLSNTRIVKIDKIITNGYFDEEHISKYRHGNYYIHQGNIENVSCSNVISYDYLEDSIGNIMKEIIDDNICFTSLFQYDKDIVSYVDIMNICAAFESQFDVTYQNYKSDIFKKIKKDVVNSVKSMKDNYPNEEELTIYNEILSGVKNYSDYLRNKIDFALFEFEKLYDESKDLVDIKFDFKDDYKEMPKRIKDARNHLDHGSTYHFNGSELTDTYLLRAITYFMILKHAGVDNNNIMKCIRIFTRFGV